MMFETDFKRLIMLLLPSWLRRPVIFGLLRAGAVGVEQVHTQFKTMRKGHIFRLTHNGQVCYLRGALNETFGRGFQIDAMPQEGEWLYAVTESGEGIPVTVREPGPGVPVVYSEQVLNQAQNDFTVYVPARYWPRLAEIEALVDKYKLITKRAHYVKKSDTPIVGPEMRDKTTDNIQTVKLK